AFSLSGPAPGLIEAGKKPVGRRRYLRQGADGACGCVAHLATRDEKPLRTMFRVHARETALAFSDQLYSARFRDHRRPPRGDVAGARDLRRSRPFGRERCSIAGAGPTGWASII